MQAITKLSPRPGTLLTAVIALALVWSSGCSRSFYRRQADIDAYALVREKANHPHWRLDNYSISVDPRSRMYDPYAIDCPPIPPDDPTSHQLMHCVDNKRGWPFWHDNGDRPFVDNPAWPEYIEVDERGMVRTSADDAVRLALLNSREYQRQLETLYLSALDVSAERFAFDTQLFAGYSVFGTWLGRVAGGGNSESELALNTFSARGNSWSLRRTFSTGSTLAVNFANSLIWQFSGPDDYRGSTLIDFNLIQPLLREGGRDFFLEDLTQAERNLLADVRSLEQFQRAFSVEIITGSSATAGPRAATGGAGGFIGLLQTQRQIGNQEENVRRLRRNMGRLLLQLKEQPQERTEPYLSQNLQVAQTRQQLISAESSLVTQRNSYQAQLDNFKFVLGLPPQICFEPSDDMLNQFELIDQGIIRLPEDWETLLTSHAAARGDIPVRIQLNVQAETRPGMESICRLNRYPEFEQDLLTLQAALVQWQQFAETIVNDHLPAIRRDVERMQQAIPRRKAWIDKVVARIEELRKTPCELLPLEVDPLEAFGDAEYAKDLVAQVLSAIIPRTVTDSLAAVESATAPDRLADGALGRDMLAPLVTALSQEPIGRSESVKTALSQLEMSLAPGAVGDGSATRTALLQLKKALFLDQLEQLYVAVGPDVIGDGAAARNLLEQLGAAVSRETGTEDPVIQKFLRRLESVLSPETLRGGPNRRNLLWRIDRSLGDAEDSYENLVSNFQEYARSLAARGAILQELLADGNLTPEQLFDKLVRGVYDPNYVCGRTRILTFDVVEQVTRELTELQLLQAVARAESIELQDIEIKFDNALEVARRYRRDWMNARAALVDAWRQIQVSSDALQSTLDVTFEGDVRNVSDNPFRLRARAGSLRAGVQFDAPITRLLERNNYRGALIAYQQARREYYAFEDSVALQLRSTLRTLTSNQINFELQRLALFQAARQVMLNTFIDQESQRALTTRVTAARDSVSALNDLLNSQNAFMGVWVNYEVLRMSLDRDLGTIQIDSEGLWIDPGRIGADYGQFDPWLRVDQAHGGPAIEEVHGMPVPTKRTNPADELPPAFMLPSPDAASQPRVNGELPPLPPARNR